MSIKVLHQCGHITKWNIESFEEDRCGDGLILSPVHCTISQIDKLNQSIKDRALFDPQYYLPNSQKAKLKTYPFFPETIANGFSTQDFPLSALESAKQCLDFQIEQGFENIIIPARYFDQMDPDYTSKQDIYTVHPFLKKINEMGIEKDAFLTLPLTSHMVENETYRTQILNWATSFPEIKGVYVIAAHERDRKQIHSKEFLTAYLDFLVDLRNADLQLIIGYSNTESLIYSLIGDSTLTFGTFENTRMFSVDKFIVSDEERRGPQARIYLPGLYNWVQIGQAKQIKSDMPELWEEIYRPTEYSEKALAALAEPTFNQPDLYKHHFICFYEQISELSAMNITERYEKLRRDFKIALEIYERIERARFDFEKHGAGTHLQYWLDTINHYYAKHLKS